jgi:hypothetical protein
MSYYDDRSFVMPAKDEEILAFRASKSESRFPGIPKRPKSGYYGRSEFHHFSEEERQLVNDRRRRKKHVREAYKHNANLRGPFNVTILEGWHQTCETRRRMIMRIHDELKRGAVDPFEAQEHLTKYKDEHRRTIAIIRSTRLGSASQWSPICRHPFYVEPNNHHVPEDDAEKAEKHGVVWHRVYLTIPSVLFFRLQKRFAKTGRITGLWTDKYDVDDTFGRDQNDDRNAPVRCMFAFSDPAEVEKLEEEVVWIKMRF